MRTIDPRRAVPPQASQILSSETIFLPSQILHRWVPLPEHELHVFSLTVSSIATARGASRASKAASMSKFTTKSIDSQRGKVGRITLSARRGDAREVPSKDACGPADKKAAARRRLGAQIRVAEERWWHEIGHRLPECGEMLLTT